MPKFFQKYGFLPSDLDCYMEMPTETGDFVQTVEDTRLELPGVEEYTGITS